MGFPIMASKAVLPYSLLAVVRFSDFANAFQQQHTCTPPLRVHWGSVCRGRWLARCCCSGSGDFKIPSCLFVAIFENRFDTYSADPLDYWAYKLSFRQYCVLVMMDWTFMKGCYTFVPLSPVILGTWEAEVIWWWNETYSTLVMVKKLDWIPAYTNQFHYERFGF